MCKLTRSAFFCLACMAAVSSAKASILFSIGSVIAMPGDVNDAVDVLITNLGPDPVDVSGFTFEITASSAGVTLESATTQTIAPYIFAGNSFVENVFGTSTISFSSPGQTLDASDSAFASNSASTIAANQTLGLGRLFFDVDPADTVGNPSLDFNSANSNLSNGLGNPLAIDTFNSGTIEVVPEPRTGIEMVFALAAIGVYVRRRAFRYPEAPPE
jgi:hypothetical protein